MPGLGEPFGQLVDHRIRLDLSAEDSQSRLRLRRYRIGHWPLSRKPCYLEGRTRRFCERSNPPNGEPRPRLGQPPPLGVDPGKETEDIRKNKGPWRPVTEDKWANNYYLRIDPAGNHKLFA